MSQVYAAQIDTMTVEDLGQQMTVIDIIDKGNMNEKRFAKLRLLAQQFELSALDEKLRNIREPSTVSSSPTPGADETAERYRFESYDDYDTLTQMGGRPSAPIQPDPGSWNPTICDEHLHVLRHWEIESRRTGEELDRWKAFCKYQTKKRESLEVFKDYKRTLAEYKRLQGIHWDIGIQLDPRAQSNLSLWKEYYLYEYRKLARLERRLQAVEQLPEPQRSREGRLWGANNDMEMHNTLLQWIKDQLHQIAAESGRSLEDTSNSSDATTLQNLLRWEPSKELQQQTSLPQSFPKCILRRSKRLAERKFTGVTDRSKISKPVKERNGGIYERRMVSNGEVTAPEESKHAVEDALGVKLDASVSRKLRDRGGARKSQAKFNIDTQHSSKVSKQRCRQSKSVRNQRPSNSLRSSERAVRAARGSDQCNASRNIRRSARIQELFEKKVSVQPGV